MRTVTVQEAESGERVALTGHIQAQDEVAMAFRIGGRMIERPVNVGDRVDTGTVLAKLDPEDEANNFRSAQAGQAAARAALSQSQANFERQRTLLAQGHTPRAQFELAERALHTAQAQVDDSEAQFRIATDRLRFTILSADAPGHITARGAEAGEVVQAGRTIVTIAREGGRDAVFDVPARLLRSAPPDATIDVVLSEDPKVKATGRVREVSPQADPVTRTFLVRVGLKDPPPDMRLGSTVTGSVVMNSSAVISVPASALMQWDNKPAVWVVDPKKLTVSPRAIEVMRFDPSSVVVSHGLDNGELVVTAGVQALHPDQTVRLLGAT